MPPNPLFPTFKIPLFTLIFLLTILPPTHQYIDLPLTITRPSHKTGQISYAFQIDVQGYKQNITISLSNSHPDSVTPVSDMKKIYKEKKLKKSNYKSTKNHNNVFGLLEVSSLEGYTFEGWKRYFMEVFLYVESRYFHQIQVNLDDVVGGGDDEHQAKLGEALSNGVMSLGPKLKENKIYQEIKKNTDLISFDIIAIYSGVGQRNNRLQLGGYQQQYARGDAKTGALLYQFPLKATQNYWQLAVQKVYFTRSKSKKTDQFLLHTQPNLYRLSLQQQYITFPESMRSSIQSYVQSQNNQCKFGQFLQCNNMSTIDISLSEFAFQLTPNYFINVSLYDLRRDYEPETKRVSFYIRLSQDIDQIQIGAAILKEYYIAIDMNQPALLYSGINRFKSQFSSVYVLRFFAYFIVFTLVMAIIVGIWANFSDPNRRNKLRYGRQGIQLVSYQRPGGIFINNGEDIDQ